MAIITGNLFSWSGKTGEANASNLPIHDFSTFEVASHRTGNILKFIRTNIIYHMGVMTVSYKAIHNDSVITIKVRHDQDSPLSKNKFLSAYDQVYSDCYLAKLSATNSDGSHSYEMKNVVDPMEDNFHAMRRWGSSKGWLN